MHFGGKCIFIAALALLAFPDQPFAGGFYVPYESTAGLGRAFAGDAQRPRIPVRFSPTPPA